MTGRPPLEVSPVVAPDWEEAGESRVRKPAVTNEVAGRGPGLARGSRPDTGEVGNVEARAGGVKRELPDLA